MEFKMWTIIGWSRYLELEYSVWLIKLCNQRDCEMFQYVYDVIR